MKRILVTGNNGYIGNSFEKWVSHDNNYSVTKISVRNDDWTTISFAKFDVVLHLAGVAHVSTDPNMAETYYRINRDLTLEIAKKAKLEGVRHFIFMSSIIVYGNKNKKILRETTPDPENFYGRSKLEAEVGLNELKSSSFKIAIIRPPMIYGKGSKGNYPRLSRLSRRTPIFPDYQNHRSVLHIDNLTEFIKKIIEHSSEGIYFPQNKELVSTTQIVQEISKVHNKKVKFVQLFNFIIRPLIKKSTNFNKVFGNLIIDPEISEYSFNYQVHEFEKSIELTEE